MGKLIFGRVVATRDTSATANGNPRPVVTIVPAGGTIDDATEHEWSADAADAYGAGNPERREHVHAYRTTAAGRLARIDHDATNAYRYLADLFPRHAHVSVLADRRAGESWPVRVLVANGAVVVDATWAVALVTDRRRDRAGRIRIPGAGADPSHAIVRQLAHVLHGDADALNLARV